ncbi:hypothetical protein [Rhodococcus erythropolis]
MTDPPIGAVMTDLPPVHILDNLIDQAFAMRELGQTITRVSEELIFEAEKHRRAIEQYDTESLLRLFRVSYNLNELRTASTTNVLQPLRALRMG